MSIQEFAKKFGYPVSKEYPTKVEYRGVGDLDNVVNNARNFISKNNLPFRVVTSGSLAQIKGFIVEEV